MRIIWKGSLHFGLIAIPVGLAPVHRKGEISFRTLHRGTGKKVCGLPIEQLRSCPEHGLVDEAELGKGWEVAPGQFVIVEEDELAALAPDSEARAIELFAVVGAGDLDTLSIRRSYWLAPSEQPVGRKPYAALAASLRETECVALGRLVAWEAEHLCAVRPDGARALALQLLRFPEDRIAPEPIEEALEDVELSAQEADLARELAMKLFTSKPEHLDLAASHRDRVRALLEGKLAGQAIVRPERAARQTELPTVELAEALRRSIRAAGRRPPPKRKRTKATAKSS